jgi:hypothetical protein
MQCPMKKGLKLCGHGFPNAMFNCFSMPLEIEDQNQEFLALLTILRGAGTAAVIEKELSLLTSNKKWTVKQLDEKEFLVTFPNEITRDFLIGVKSFDFKTAPITAMVQQTDRDDDSETLKVV